MKSEWIALTWLIFLAGLCLAYFFRQLRRSDYSLWESCLYLPTYLLGRLLWRVRFMNEPPAAIQAGAILVANHRSSVDPFFVQLAARRRVHWMVAKEYCQHFLFGPLLRALQVIPTNRSGMDTACTKAALRITKAGRLVGMFPEGRINTSPRLLLPVRSGAALVAIRSKVPLIPLYIEGSPPGRAVWSPLFQPARVSIVFGTPIFPNGIPMGGEAGETGMNEAREDPNADSLTLEWAKQIVQLSGQPDFPVELASKRRNRHMRHSTTTAPEPLP